MLQAHEGTGLQLPQLSTGVERAAWIHPHTGQRSVAFAPSGLSPRVGGALAMEASMSRSTGSFSGRLPRLPRSCLLMPSRLSELRPCPFRDSKRCPKGSPLPRESERQSLLRPEPAAPSVRSHIWLARWSRVLRVRAWAGLYGCTVQVFKQQVPIRCPVSQYMLSQSPCLHLRVRCGPRCSAVVSL